MSGNVGNGTAATYLGNGPPGFEASDTTNAWEDAGNQMKLEQAVHGEGVRSCTLGGNVRKAFCMAGAGLEGKLTMAENVLFFEPFPLTTWKG